MLAENNLNVLLCSVPVFVHVPLEFSTVPKTNQQTDSVPRYTSGR